MITTYEELKEKINRVTIAKENIDKNTSTEADLTSAYIMSNPQTEPKFIIDLNTRIISIPPELYCVGIENDHNAETIYFETNRYFDDIDLYNASIAIQQINGLGKKYVFPVVYKYVDQSEEGESGERLSFGWTLSSDVLAAAGKIYFTVRFFELENNKNIFKYNLNTKIAEVQVEKGLNVLVADEGIKEADDLSRVLESISNLENKYLANGQISNILNLSVSSYLDEGIIETSEEVI